MADEMIGYVNLAYEQREPHKVEVDPIQLDAREPMRYEQLVRWATAEWKRRYSDVEAVAIWAWDAPASDLARSRLKPGRRISGNLKFKNTDALDCPFAIPVTSWYSGSRKVRLTGSIGAFDFTLEANGKAFHAIYANAYYSDHDSDTVAIVVVPRDYVTEWCTFQTHCQKLAQYIERSQNVHIIGGNDNSFTPDVEWDQVILSEQLKSDLRGDIETFFSKGVGIYKQLGLPPFRKLLLVGPPGTGKTTLCEALAKLVLQKKCVVVYVSASDRDGASFNKIHRALQIIATARHPVMMIVEEIDVYLKGDDKSQILNVLDGMESPNNPRGALLIATTNYPEVIDERIAKRPGRIDRIVHVPVIQDAEQAERMLRRYMGAQFRDEHCAIVPTLVGQTGAFVREVALYARMLAAYKFEIEITLDMLQQSIHSLSDQLSTGLNLLPRRPIGFRAAK